VASDRLGSESPPCSHGIILTSSPYPFHPIKGEDFSWGKLAWEKLVGKFLSFVAWSFWSLSVGFELYFVKIDC
jgi:hypothetical protein